MRRRVAGPLVPLAPLVLGFGGLLPFVALVLLAAFSAPPWNSVWLNALAYYGAVILSFVGALHWSHALRRGAQGASAWWQYGFSVLPALVAWCSLLLPLWTGLRIQAVALALCLVADRTMTTGDPLPAWFMQLRAVLTVVAACALAAASLL